MQLDSTVRQQVILAALTATGGQRDEETAEAWEARAMMNAAKFAAILGNERHPLYTAIAQIEDSKVFTGEVVSIVREPPKNGKPSSTRGIVTLNTGTTRKEDGMETVRTERTDNPIGLAMAKRIRSLVGHRVVVWVQVEQMKNSEYKSRVIRHVEDLGLARDGHD